MLLLLKGIRQGSLLVVQVRDDYSGKGFRLVAVAVGVLHDVDKLDTEHMLLPEIEAHALQLELLGLIMLSNQIRPVSKSNIQQLQHGYGGHDCVWHCYI